MGLGVIQDLFRFHVFFLILGFEGLRDLTPYSRYQDRMVKIQLSSTNQPSIDLVKVVAYSPYPAKPTYLSTRKPILRSLFHQHSFLLLRL